MISKITKMFSTEIELFYKVVSASVDSKLNMKFEVIVFNGDDRLQPVVYECKYNGGNCIEEAEDYLMSLPEFEAAKKTV